MRTGTARTAVEALPLYQVEPEGAGFVATGDDPQFELRVDGGISPGWYRLRVRMPVSEGHIVAPCLYLDLGEGLSEAGRVDLPEPGRDGWVDAVLAIPAAPRFLRLDPSIQRARFALLGLSFSRISRPQALMHMLLRLASGGPGIRTAFGHVAGLLGGAVRGRLRPAAQRLVDAYRSCHRFARRGYADWVDLFAAEGPPCHGEPAGTRRPLVSILLPVCDTPVPLLRACIESVLAQTDGAWELCIADDASRRSEVRTVLEAYRARDPRIRVAYGDERLHISGNTNRALALATGDFVGFLDHDDLLAPEAVAEVAAALERFPDARLLYTDEDKIDAAGRRHSPHFKPAWSPELLRGLNYIAHFMVVQTALVRDLGGLRAGFEGSQDHDLALRCTERIAHADIVHIPRVLYHWRTTAGSTALGVHQKPYAIEAGRLAVAEHLARTRVDGEVRAMDDGRYRVVRRLGPNPPRVTVLVPTRDRVDLLRTCVESVLARTRYPSFDILVVDNGSTDPETLAFLDEASATGKVSVLPHPAPFNFSAIVNRGIRSTDADIVCLLNNDIEVINADWLREMVSHAVRPKVGVVGAMLYYPDDTIQHAGVILGIGGVAGHSHCRQRRGSDGYISRARVVQNLTAVTGACMVFRREVFDAVDGFDEGLAVAFNDIDFCMRVHARGHFNVWTPFAELYHHESASRGREDTPEKQARFTLEAELMKRRWGGALEHDPYYNPNLSLDNEGFDLAFPPRAHDCRTRQLPSPLAA